jgi:hypothetical protein
MLDDDYSGSFRNAAFHPRRINVICSRIYIHVDGAQTETDNGAGDGKARERLNDDLIPGVYIQSSKQRVKGDAPTVEVKGILRGGTGHG